MADTLHVLLIDDNADDRTLVARELRQEFSSAVLTQVGDARSLAEALADGKFNLVITDFHLGWTNGLEVLRAVKAQRPECPVIMFTGTGNEEVAVAALKTGLDDYIIKNPRHFVRLRAAVHTALDQAEKRRVMRHMEKRFQALIEKSTDGIALVGTDGVIQYVSPSTSRLLGYAGVELLGPFRQDWVHPEDRARVAQQGEELLRRPEHALEIICRLRHKDGTWHWVEGVATNLVLEPSVRAVVINYRDVTERKEAEAARERLYEQAQANRERLQVLSRRLLEAQESERRRLARELHDELGQVLTVISINLQTLKGLAGAAALPRLEECLQIVDRALEQVRSLSLDLRPSMLDDIGLEAALRWYVQRQAQAAGFRVRLTSNLREERLPADLETTCFRLAQEALTNVVRHAQARHVWLDIERRLGELAVTIRDDGVGFDVPAARQRAIRGGSLGVLGMRERVELAGGSFLLESSPGKGTRIQARFPLP